MSPRKKSTPAKAQRGQQIRQPASGASPRRRRPINPVVDIALGLGAAWVALSQWRADPRFHDHPGHWALVAAAIFFIIFGLMRWRRRMAARSAQRP